MLYVHVAQSPPESELTVSTGNEVHESTDAAAQKQLGLFNVAANTVSGLVGLQCSPLSVLVVGSSGSNW